MPWHPDVPDLPDRSLEKPYALERLEKLPPEVLNSMTSVESEERIRDAANGIAKSYTTAMGSKSNYEECVFIVSSALAQTGGSLSGPVGQALVAHSDAAASEACKQLFPDPYGINEFEY